MALLRGNGQLGDLGWGIPDFIKEGLNPVHHFQVGMNLIKHPVDTFKEETGKAIGFTAAVARPWVGGPGGAAPSSNYDQQASGLQQQGPAGGSKCGFFDRLVRFFGGHPSCSI